MNANNSIVPYFNRGSKWFIDFKEIPARGFSHNTADYFMSRFEDGEFEIHAWLDVLTAPWYVIDEEISNGAKYSRALQSLFYTLFPSPANYRETLNGRAEDVNSFLTHVKNGTEDQTEIFMETEAIWDSMHEIARSLIRPHQNNLKNQYLLASYTALSDFETKLKLFSEEIILTNPLDIRYQYYKSKPWISWEEYPLSFFKNILYGDGVPRIFQDLNYELQQYGDTTKDKFFEQVLRREYKLSCHLVKAKLSALDSKIKKQAYVDSLCLQISILVNKSNNHLINEHYPEPLRPYQLIIHDLKKKYKTLTFNTSFLPELEPEEIKVETRKFLKSLLSLQITDVEGHRRLLFKDKILFQQLGYLITGNLEEIPVLRLNWPTETFYYLLTKLLENKASFNPTQLEKSKKIFLEDDTRFSARNYFPYKNKIIRGTKKPAKEFAQIDALF